MWEERYQAFLQKYKEFRSTTITQLSRKKRLGRHRRTSGMGALQVRPHPAQRIELRPDDPGAGRVSYQHKTEDLTLKDILDVGFQDWLQKMERGVTGMSNSTGNMMREMVLKGPSSYDSLFVYESVTIDYLKNAEGRWGKSA